MKKTKEKLWHRTGRFQRIVATIALGFYCASASLLMAQNPSATVTLNEKNKPIKEILAKIEKSTDFHFFYNEEETDVSKNVSINIKASLTKTLETLFNGTGIKFKIENDNIVLYNEPAADNRQIGPLNIKGTVVDILGVCVSGVNVYQEGNITSGVITDFDGNFNIAVDDPNKELVFSFIGFKTKKVAIGNKTVLKVVLEEDSVLLDEVVAIGYAVAKKSSITGSITSVKAEDLPKSANASVNNMLSGKASGVQVLQTSAQPGGGVNIVIRGAGSVDAGNAPLYVIDGFPINNNSVEPGTGDYSVGKRDPLSSINPNDIESIEILKDAASTAIYGARAANGVILITTKRGKEGRTNVDISYTGSVQKVDNYFDMLDAKEFMTYSNVLGKELFLINRGMYPYGSIEANLKDYKQAYKIAEIAAAGKGTDWWDEVTRTGMVHDVNLSVSGGNSKTNFLISGNMFDQKGLIENSDFRRVTGRLNIDHKIIDQLKVGVSATGSNIDNGNVQMGGTNQTSGVLMSALQMSPLASVYDENGNYYINPLQATLPNPVSFREIDDHTIQKRLLANGYIEYKPIKDLTLKASVGLDTKSAQRSSYLPTTFLHGAAANGKATKEINNSTDLLFNITANYNTTINEKHNIGALIGYEYQKFNYDGFYSQVIDFFTDAFGSNNLGAGAGTPTVGSHKYANLLASYFARLSYNYKDKYIANVTLRCDGSSNFGAGNKWGFFPSAAFAWRITQEEFMKEQKVVSNLKLRLSYGKTGNSGIGDKALTYYGPTQFVYAFGDNYVIPAGISQQGNSKLKWETTTEFNIGLDYGFFKNRITGSIEYYNKVVSDLLSYRTLPLYNEIRKVAENIGSTQLSGVEFDIHTVNIEGKFRWTTDFNISSYNDKWKERNPNVVLDPWVGEHDPIRAIYGFKTEGIVQVGQDVPHMTGELPGNLIYKDVNGFDENHQLTGKPDGKINDADKVFLGSTDPGFSFGLGNTFEYKGFDLYIFFYGMGNRILLNQNKQTFLYNAERLSTANSNMMASIKDLWTSENQSATMPGIAPNPYQGQSDFLIEDASFIRLKNLTLGYTFPRKLLKDKVNLRLFVDAQNLLLFTKYTGVDPEMDSLGAYPNAKSVSFGLSMGF